MTTLVEKLPLPEQRAELVDACCRLLDDQVSQKRGLSGLSIKAGYKIFTSLKPGAVREAVDALLDDFLDALNPMHEDFKQTNASGSFGGYLQTHAPEAAEKLVGVTDQRAERSKHIALKKGYLKLRPLAVRNVEEAVPALARLMDRHYQA